MYESHKNLTSSNLDYTDDTCRKFFSNHRQALRSRDGGNDRYNTLSRHPSADGAVLDILMLIRIMNMSVPHLQGPFKDPGVRVSPNLSS